MSFERSSGIPFEPAPPSAAAPSVTEETDAEPVSPQLRLQILSTEHWSLLASRSLAWNESFSRASMFLTTLSAVIVALGLSAQASGFGSSFLLFALVLLPVVLFVGITTFLRLGGSNHHDAQCVIGMNRIRHAYLELAPELERYFVMSSHDDLRGVGISMGVDPRTPNAIHLIAATPILVVVLNAVIVGVIAALASTAAGVIPLGALGLGVIGFALGFLTQITYARRSISSEQEGHTPLFPG